MHRHVNKLENYLNVRLSEISTPDLVDFKEDLGKVRADIVILQHHQIVLSSDPTTEEFEDEGLLFDITRKPVKKGTKMAIIKIKARGKKLIVIKKEEPRSQKKRQSKRR